jgi:hypothetical protein
MIETKGIYWTEKTDPSGETTSQMERLLEDRAYDLTKTKQTMQTSMGTSW